MNTPNNSLPARSVSVVTVTYHTGPVLFTMIASVLKQPEVKEMVLVNNGNPADVLERIAIITREDNRLRLVDGHGNVGFATASNMGARAATGDYIFILNPDCILPEGLAAAMLRESARFPRPHLISARVLDRHGVEQSGRRRELLTPANAFSEVFKAYRMFPDVKGLSRFNRHHDPVPDHTVAMPATSGAVMFFPKEDYWMVGGFDADYFLHVEDLDLCLRFTRAGGTIYYMPNPPVMHLGGTSDTPKVKVEYLKTKSFVRYFYKNFKGTSSPVLLAVVAAGTWLRFGLMAVKGVFSRPRHADVRSAEI